MMPKVLEHCRMHTIQYHPGMLISYPMMEEQREHYFISKQAWAYYKIQCKLCRNVLIFFFKVGFMPSMEPNVGLELMTLRSRPELRSRVRCLTNKAIQVPQECLK